ncbi:chaplin [Streptomyces sp. NPDC089424]|uniref:chaplin n=1 Tax=Streptomyces sp. NPDC089424 TaxID=3365917 RepID=UPI0038253B8A
MKRVTRNSVFAVAASGAMAMALPMSAALAADGSSAEGVAAGSPGVASGNAIQIPVHVPVSICGNTVNVVGLLNPAAGNSCANKGGSKAAGSKDSTATDAGSTSEDSTTSSEETAASGGASAQGLATDSPGLLSGNGIQLPIDLPVNVSGNSVNVVGLGNPVFGNTSVNGPGEQPTQPPKTSTPNIPAPTPAPSTPAKPVTPKSPALVPAQPGPHVEVPQLAHTGADLAAPAAAGTAALLITGTILFRRARAGQSR